MTQSAITLPTGTPAPKASEAAKPAPTTASATEQSRVTYAFLLAAGGLLATIILAGVVAWYAKSGFEKLEITSYASAISSVVTPFLTVLGTLVGTFFGVQVGASGKAELAQQVTDANNKTADANNKAAAFAGQLEPDKLEAAIKAYSSLTLSTK